MTKRMDQLLEKQKKLLAKKQQAEADEKAVKKQIRELARNERTHRLCNRGGYVEKLLETLGAPELTDEEMFGYLDYVLNTRMRKGSWKNYWNASGKPLPRPKEPKPGV